MALTLIKNATLVTMDPAFGDVEGGDLGAVHAGHEVVDDDGIEALRVEAELGQCLAASGEPRRLVTQRCEHLLCQEHECLLVLHQ